jgi:uncharacterized membrane protein
VPEYIGGLPLHPLVVHFVVVLLPIAVLGSILSAVSPWVRRRFGWLTVVAAAAGAGAVQVATVSGNNLKAGLTGLSKDLGDNPLINRHEELASIMIWWALGLFVAVTALMILHTTAQRRTDATAEPEGDFDGGGGVATATRRSTGQTVALVVAMLATVGVAVGTGIHVFRVGDAGARTVWEDVGTNLQQQGN